MNTVKLPYITLLLLISFASVNAVLFSPALPMIANFFGVSEGRAQLTISWFLVGYALGQLIYGPIANRFGRKNAIYSGVILQIISSTACGLSGWMHSFTLLIVARFLLALGSGVGLKMTYTLINETHDAIQASKKLSYLMIAFAMTPSIGVMLGGVLTAYFGWESTFYAGTLYGLILLFLATQLPETKLIRDLDAFKLDHLISGYLTQFKNINILFGGFLIGCGTCFVYVFATLAPFIAMDLMHMKSSTYGFANLLPPVGLMFGSWCSAHLINKYKIHHVILLGMVLSFLGAGLMLFLVLSNAMPFISLFMPMFICYFGLSMTTANIVTLTLKNVEDKAHGSAVLNFFNMGLVTVVILSLGYFSLKIILLPFMLIVISVGMLCVFPRWSPIKKAT